MKAVVKAHLVETKILNFTIQNCVNYSRNASMDVIEANFSSCEGSISESNRTISQILSLVLTGIFLVLYSRYIIFKEVFIVSLGLYLNFFLHGRLFPLNS